MSIKRQLQMASKYYFFDTGVLNALQGETTIPKPSTFRYGKLFETFVVNELIKAISVERLPVKVYHYLTVDSQEIDIILHRGPRYAPVAIEIKSAVAPSIEDVPALKVFINDNVGASAFVLCKTPQAYQQDNIYFLPFMAGIKSALKSAAIQSGEMAL